MEEWPGRPSERHPVPFESYHKRKKALEEKYCELINLKTFNDDIVIADNKQQDRKSTRLNSSHSQQSRMPSSA